jgi:hypothetical protein
LVPASALSVVVFFLFVAPGMCYELLRSRTLLPREESAFIQISRILLSGILLTALAALLLAGVHAIRPSSALANVGSLMVDGVPYLAGHLARVGWTLLAQLALSALLAVLISDVRSRKSSRLIHQTNSWHIVAETLAKPNQQVAMSVRLKCGAEVLGNYLGASTEFDPAKRELILRAPLTMRATTDGPMAPLDVAWQCMVIPGSEITSLSTAYVDENHGQPTPSVRWWMKAGQWISGHYLSWYMASVASLLLLGLVALIAID